MCLAGRRTLYYCSAAIHSNPAQRRLDRVGRDGHRLLCVPHAPHQRSLRGRCAGGEALLCTMGQPRPAFVGTSTRCARYRDDHCHTVRYHTGHRRVLQHAEPVVPCCAILRHPPRRLQPGIVHPIRLGLEPSAGRLVVLGIVAHSGLARRPPSRIRPAGHRSRCPRHSDQCLLGDVLLLERDDDHCSIDHVPASVDSGPARSGLRDPISPGRRRPAIEDEPCHEAVARNGPVACPTESLRPGHVPVHDPVFHWYRDDRVVVCVPDSPMVWTTCFLLTYNGRALDTAFPVAMFKPRQIRPLQGRRQSLEPCDAKDQPQGFHNWCFVASEARNPICTK